LRGDTNAASRAAHAAFKNRVHAQSFGNSADVLVLATEGESRSTGDNFERGNLRQQVDDLFGETVAEAILLLVVAHVGEGQHGDGGSDGYGSAGRCCPGC